LQVWTSRLSIGFPKANEFATLNNLILLFLRHLKRGKVFHMSENKFPFLLFAGRLLKAGT
jgi:hypothetical protein